MWQKCPICDGEGRITSNGLSSSVHQVCPVCKGAKIISELNGLPPNNSIKLPSDEEIEIKSQIIELEYHGMQYTNFNQGLKKGAELMAKWMKEQILNQNK